MEVTCLYFSLISEYSSYSLFLLLPKSFSSHLSCHMLPGSLVTFFFLVVHEEFFPRLPTDISFRTVDQAITIAFVMYKVRQVAPLCFWLRYSCILVLNFSNINGLQIVFRQRADILTWQIIERKLTTNTYTWRFQLILTQFTWSGLRHYYLLKQEL